MSEKINIRDIRHAEKISDIKPEDITQEDVQKYKDTHNLGPNINEDIIKQILIINRGGPVYEQKNWDSKLNPEDKTTITYEGIRTSHDFANEIFEKANRSKGKSVYLFISSPMGRTLETQAVIRDRIEQLSKRDGSNQAEVVSVENILDTLNEDLPDKKSVFMFQTQGAEDLGAISSPILGKVGKFFQDETINEMLWYAKPDEIEGLKQELISEKPESRELIEHIESADYQTPPEEVVIRILDFYKKLIESVKKISQDRDVNIICISHNLILDATTISLLGKEISANSVKELGKKAREPLEGSHISISDDKLTIKHRGHEKSINLADLEQLIHDLEQKLIERKKDWGIKE